jgi:hypothetical protein
MRLIPVRVVRRSLYVGAAGLFVMVVGLAARSTAAAPPKPITTTTLYTADAGGSTYEICEVRNVSAVYHTISMQIIDFFDGTVLDQRQGDVIPPGGRDTATAYNRSTYCKITVDGPTSDVRGALLVTSSDGFTASAVIPAY